MAGHSKWANIKHKKAITDAKRSKLFSKIARSISVEAKLADGKDSAGLRAAVAKAKKMNVPKDIIDRAIKKAGESKSMERVTYEAYGPGGVGIIIDALTDNNNRTAAEIKHILSKNSLELAGMGSVLWAFKKDISPEGLVYSPASEIDLSDKDLESLSNLVEELEENDDVQEVFTNAK